MRRRTLPVIALAAATALVACTEQASGPDDGPDATSAPPEPVAPEVRQPEESTTVVDQDDPVALAAATARALFTSAPVVVVAPVDDADAQARAAGAAVALGMPMVLTAEDQATDDASGGPEDEQSPETDGSAEAPETEDATPPAEEVERLQAQAALVFGAAATDGWDVDVVTAPADDTDLAALLEATEAETDTEDPVRALLEAVPGELTLPTAASPATPDDGTGDAASPATPDDGSGDDTTGDDASGAEGDAATAQTTPDADGQDTEAPDLPATTPAEPLDALVLTTGAVEQLAAVATARAAQAAVQVVPEGDPRASSASVQAVAEADPGTVVGLGGAFGDASTLEWQVATAATGTELPGGGQLVLPGKTYVALYGNPTTGALGVLGEQGPEATIERAREHAAPYEDLTDTTVVPALEIIATVASAGAGDDGNYSSERPVEELRPLVDLARENDQYVVLDLQPGRTDFVTQAELYAELLREPHVGLALDPEWRLEPDEVHLRQIGQVPVEEVNEVVTWLADFTREHQLPQKLLILHQFQVRMIPGVDDVDQSRPELAILIHADGQGSQPAKQDTWRVLRNHAPSVQYWGWKNFYDEDSPMLTPEQTMQVEPVPQFISYQ